MKICSRCGLEFPTTDFHLDSRSKGGRRPYCKHCRKKWWAESKSPQPARADTALGWFLQANPSEVVACVAVLQETVLELADFSGPATLQVSYSTSTDSLVFDINARHFWLDGDGKHWIQDRLGMDDTRFQSALATSLRRLLEER